MTKTFEQMVTEDRRLVILHLLMNSTAYEANAFLLERALETSGHRVSYDRLLVDLSWLKEQELIDASELGTVTIARLLTRGQDVARGVTTVPGVQRPRAGF
jgi:hypothetical protein